MIFVISIRKMLYKDGENGYFGTFVSLIEHVLVDEIVWLFNNKRKRKFGTDEYLKKHTNFFAN